MFDLLTEFQCGVGERYEEGISSAKAIREILAKKSAEKLASKKSHEAAGEAFLRKSQAT